MKTVLCFGDSLTWGYNAEGPARHAFGDRWPSVLQAALGNDIHVVAEGLNGRTTAFDDHLAGIDRNGASILPTLLVTHAPLDLIVIMLGSNDMKPWIAGRAIASKQGMERLVDTVRGTTYPLNEAPPKILIVAPPALCATDEPDFAAMFEGGTAESLKLAPLYHTIAAEMFCGFFDAGTVARTTPLDGVHLDAENTRKIGEALAPVVRRMLDL